MRANRKIAAMVVCSVLGAATAATARETKMELGGFLGVHIFSENNGLGRRFYDSTANAIETGALLGVRVGVEVHPRLVLEGELAISPTQTKNGESVVTAIGWRAHVLVHLL